jgi:cysteine desulfurase
MRKLRTPIYLDYMATTPVDPRVAAKMQHYLTMENGSIFANPASQHFYGRQAKAAIDEARNQTAALLNATSDEIIWTSGATEANNLALKGAALFYQRQGKHLITCATEHHAVLAPLRYLETLGFAVTYLKPEADGLLDLKKLEQAFRPDTLLVSLMHVNSEIGVIQNLAAVGKLTRTRGVLFHVDAAQSAGKIALDVKQMQIDLLSLTAHKFYGPKGIGALYVRGNPRLHLAPLIHGGEQERNMRAGTLAPHQIAGMGEACRIAQQEIISEKENARVLALREYFWNEIKMLPGLIINGCTAPNQRIAGNLNISFHGIDSEVLLAALDNDIAVSTGSACSSTAFDPSHVLLALGLPRQLAASSLRFSFGRYTTRDEVDYAAKHLKTVVTKLRATD